MKKPLLVLIAIGFVLIIVELITNLPYAGGFISGNVKGFAVTESGYVGINTGNNLIIVDQNGETVVVKDTILRGRGVHYVKAEGDSFVIESRTGHPLDAEEGRFEELAYYRKYGLDGREIEKGERALTIRGQDLSLPIEAGTSIFTCEKELFGAAIFEQTNNGERVLRYETPSSERTMRLISAIAGIILGIDFILVWVFIIRDYKVTKRGWVRKDKA